MLSMTVYKMSLAGAGDRWSTWSELLLILSEEVTFMWGHCYLIASENNLKHIQVVDVLSHAPHEKQFYAENLKTMRTQKKEQAAWTEISAAAPGNGLKY